MDSIFDNLNDILHILNNQHIIINNLNERVVNCIITLDTLRKESLEYKKIKKVKIIKERHPCSGFNCKNEMCAVVGTENIPGTNYWFCWRHIAESEKYISKLEDPNHPKPKIQLVSESDTDSDIDLENEREEYYNKLAKEHCLENCKNILNELEKELCEDNVVKKRIICKKKVSI
jgi:hypothetical protein